MVVMPGMLISAVNGFRGEPEAMANALLSEEVLTVRFVPIGSISLPFVTGENMMAVVGAVAAEDESLADSTAREERHANCAPRRPAAPPPRQLRHAAPPELPPGLPPALPLHGPPTVPLELLLGQLAQGTEDNASTASEESV
mmetsp:Transcript_147624/g.256231  ORF Transcript_147624/g.256231 Transcript_147624/m.256231 type:complete len:142 (-) Transcript_147624:84-509(-)